MDCHINRIETKLVDGDADNAIDTQILIDTPVIYIEGSTAPG